MDDFEGFKTSLEEVTAELELEVEPEDVMNCCNLMTKF